MNETVIYKNSMNAVAFPKLTAIEYDILYSILYKVKNRKDEVIEMSFGEVADLMNWKGKLRTKKLATSIRSMNKKLLEANFLICLDDKGKETLQAPLFYGFRTSEEDMSLKIQVNPIFVDLFNDLKANYTKLELATVTSFKSKYSKRLYAQLRQYRHSGWWQIDIDEFKNLLDIPKSYAVGSIIRDVINPAIEEIEPYFGVLVMEPQFEVRNHTRGKRPIKSFRFEFTPEPKNQLQTLEEEKPKQQKRVEYTCPQCGQKLHWIKGKKGDFLGHDRGSKCRATYQSFAEIKGFKEK